MKKKEEIIDTIIINDGNEITRLRKITSPSGNDIQIITYLYKKYVNRSAMEPITTCSSCERSINNYYWKIVSLPTNYEDLKNLIK
jgi:hypothetical protein